MDQYQLMKSLQYHTQGENPPSSFIDLCVLLRPLLYEESGNSLDPAFEWHRIIWKLFYSWAGNEPAELMKITTEDRQQVDAIAKTLCPFDGIDYAIKTKNNLDKVYNNSDSLPVFKSS